MEKLIDGSKPLEEVIKSHQNIKSELQKLSVSSSLVLTRDTNHRVTHFICAYTARELSPEQIGQAALLVARESVEIRFRKELSTRVLPEE